MLPLLASIAAARDPGPIDGFQAVDIAMERFDARSAHARSVAGQWHVELNIPVRHPDFHVPVAVVDPHSGRVVGMREGADHAAPLALAWPRNPVLDLDPIEVELDMLPAARLADSRMAMFQCRDEGELQTWWTDLGTLDVHACTRSLAGEAVDGDFLFEPVPYPADPARDEDDFVAANVYWNTHVGLNWFENHGWEPADNFHPFVEITVNQRDTDTWSVDTLSDPEAPLKPYDNAYSSGGYVDWEGEWVRPVLVYGQGTTVDLGYDADVIHHEIGHYVVKSRGGPNWSPATSFGPSYEANALNEGLADYFSSAIQGDPLVGEYVGEIADRAFIRDLSGSETCMGDLYGESHYDSLPFSQPLWQFRETLTGPQKYALDRVVVNALTAMGNNATFANTAEILVARTRIALGDELADTLEQAWVDRGVYDCDPIVPLAPGDEPRRFSYVDGSYEFGHLGPVPGYVQFRVEVEEAGSTVVLSFDQTQWQGLDLWGDAVPGRLQLAVKRGQRLLWTDDRVSTVIEYEGEDWEIEVTEWLSDADEVVEAPEVGEAIVHPDDARYLLHSYRAEFVAERAGTYVLQLLNHEERRATVRDIAVDVQPPPPAEVPEVDEGVGDAPAEGTLNGGSACGCQSSPASLLAVPLLLLAIRRR